MDVYYMAAKICGNKSDEILCKKSDVGLYICEMCDYTTGYKNDYARHMLSNKHKKKTSDRICVENDTTVFVCDICNYTTENKYVYNKHITSVRHKNRIRDTTRRLRTNECENCRKVYSSRKNLWRHKQRCSNTTLETDDTIGDSDSDAENDSEINYESENESENGSSSSDNSKKMTAIKRKSASNKMVAPAVTPELLVEIIKQNKELQSLMIEQQKYVVNNIANTTIHTNSHNKTFSIQLFLNEHCKNAIDIYDFVNSLDYSTKNLEETMKLGYVGGISKLMTDKIRATPVEQRPMHCCDEKRDKLYIKNNGEWITGNNSREILQSIIADIANNNYRTFQKWVRENPSCLTLDTPAYEKYMMIYRGVIGSRTDDEEIKHVKKILSNIIENIVIEKDRYLT